LKNLKSLVVFLCFFCFCSKAQTVLSPSIICTTSYNCTGTALNFSSSINNSLSTYTWVLIPSRALSNISNVNSPTVSLTFSIAGVYTLGLYVNTGTTSAYTNSVLLISSTPKALFNATFSDVGFPSQLILTSYSTNSVINRWHFSDSPTIDSLPNTVKNYSASGNYSVMLVTVGRQGCKDTSRYAFHIADSSGITLPNIFTPNDDDVNDVYRPTVRGIKQLSAKVFNRYSSLMHAWEGVNGFWDGHNDSGTACDAGVYFIVINATGFDGKTYKLNGQITLLR
jgi:gliding motility-associated-like protein